MKRYLIKVTYLDGIHAGTSYLMRKGGYIASNDARYEDEDTTYKSYSIAMRQCRRLEAENEIDCRLEDERIQRRKNAGKKIDGFRVFYHESYEPFEVII